MKLTKAKTAILTFFATLGAIIGAIFVYLKVFNTEEKVNIKDAFKIKNHEKETEKLPDTPNMDQTLDDIEKDIIDNG